MLETLHRVLGREIPVYGMNCGSVGFLMNPFNEDGLPQRLAARAGRRAASRCACTRSRRRGAVEEALAFNEV